MSRYYEFFDATVTRKDSCGSGGSAWYWNKLKINQYADSDDAKKVSAAINRPKALKIESEIQNINALKDRILYKSYFKLALNYEECKNKK